MELQQLRYFIAVCNEGNMTRASKKLHIAQPALSQSIKRLEDDLGVELFTRRNHRIFLNDAGYVLYREILPIISKLDELPSMLQSVSDLDKHKIKINLLAASKITTDIIIDFRENNPDVLFQVSQNQNEDDWDIKITCQLSKPRDTNSFSLREEIFLAFPLEHLASKEITSIKLKDCDYMDFISLDSSRPFKLLCDSFLDDVGIYPKFAFSSDNPQSVRELISAGLGVAFWPQYSWGNVNEDKVKLLHISDIDCKRYIVISVNNQSKGNRYIKKFIDFVKEYIDKGCNA